jgi:hypothetical protein
LRLFRLLHRLWTTAQPAAEFPWFPTLDCPTSFNVDEDPLVMDWDALGIFVRGYGELTYITVQMSQSVRRCEDR